MRIESNLQDVIQDLIIKIDNLGDSDKVLRQAAFDADALISDRIQQDGLKANETPIQSFYSVGYAKKRSKGGLQSRFVDLTFSGDMMGDFVPAPIINGWVIGFRSQKNADKAEFNEQRFGKIFELSNSEKEIIIQGINETISDILR